jgi:hypothetical protein
MPIKSLTIAPDPGGMIHLCAACGAEHTISLDRGGQKSKTGPFALRAGDTLVVRVDSAPPATVTFATDDVADLARVTAAELAAKLNAALPGVRAIDDASGLLLESATTGPGSRIHVVDGTARAALGFPAEPEREPCLSRPVLGVSGGADDVHDPNIIALRRCPDCGAAECLVRTFDASPAAFDGTPFAAHRRAVNTLAEHCKKRGWSHPHVAQHHAAETAAPVDVAAELRGEAIVLPPYVPPRGASGPTTRRVA